jgi:lysophospholipase L1-like esterase
MRVIRSAAVLMAICCVLAVTGCSAVPREGAQAQTSVVAPLRTPVVMVVGDSFTVGSGPVHRWDTYASLAARNLGWQVIVAGAAGTGFVNRGRVGRDFMGSFTEELAWRPAPDLLIVSGGHNDRRAGPARVGDAAYRLVRAAKKEWPRTRVVMIGPIWIGKAPAWTYDIRDAVASAARKAKVAFFDPLQQRWPAGGKSAVLLPDGVHPSAAGHEKLAEWLVSTLRGTSLS